MSSESAARVSSVDGLRGLLAGFVMFAHIVNSWGDGRFIGLANLCVLTFFIISGYVLTRGWRGSYVGFLVRRFVRLWPLYALCIAVGGWLSMNPPPLSLYFWYPLMGINAQLPQDPPTWSLFIEAWAMPFMPLIIWIARRPRRHVSGSCRIGRGAVLEQGSLLRDVFHHRQPSGGSHDFLGLP